jgi:hypothetical protein
VGRESKGGGNEGAQGGGGLTSSLVVGCAFWSWNGASVYMWTGERGERERGKREGQRENRNKIFQLTARWCDFCTYDTYDTYDSVEQGRCSSG